MNYRNLPLFLSLLFATCLAFLTTSCTTVVPNQPAGKTARLPSNLNQIALLLPLTGSYAGPGMAVREGFFSGYYADLQRGKSVSIRVYDTTKGPNIAQIYNEAIQNGAQLVVGPLVKEDVAQLMASTPITVPTITLNSGPSRSISPGLFQFGFNPQYEAIQAADRAYQEGRHAALVITLNNQWGKQIASAFTARWQRLGGVVVDSLAYSPNQDLDLAIKQFLKFNPGPSKSKPTISSRRQDFDTIFLMASPANARLIVPLLKFYFATNVPIYSTSFIYNGIPNPSYYHDMEGVIFPDIPWILSNKRPFQMQISQLWPKYYSDNPRLYALGLDAYYLTTKLRSLPDAPQYGLHGETGNLYLSRQQHILQQLPWAQFREGNVVLLNNGF